MNVPRLITLVAASALSLAGLGAVGTSPAAAAAGDDVIAWVEVEDGVISGGPALNSGDHGNFSGTGSYTFRETGMTSVMTVDAPAAGTYPVHVRYAAGPLSAEENVTRSMGLLTNGGARQQMSLPMTSMTDWETWRFVTYQVTLDQGANTVALQCDRGVDICRLNFDAIQVGGATPDPCTAVPAGDGWTSMFDGTFASFDQWRKTGAGGFGRQTDCTIRSIRGTGATWFTQQQTAPYTLELDWRRGDANDDSSVYVASSSRVASPTDGYRVRIGAEDSAAIQVGSTIQPADPAALASAVRPVAEWNHFTLQVTPSTVAVRLNGVLVNTLEGATPAPVSGYVGLENRGFTDQVDFRSVRIKSGIDPEVVDSTTALSVSPQAVRVKGGRTSVAVAVSSAGTTPTGDVELLVNGTRRTTLSLVDGRAAASVGPFDLPGRVTVEARYLGDATNRPSSATRSVQVTKAAAGVVATVKPRKVVARRTKATVAVGVTVPGIVATGAVRVAVGSKVYTAPLRSGRAVVALKKFKKAGRVRVVVTYLGDRLVQSAATTTTVKVRPRR